MTILVLEDDAMVRSVFIVALKRQGYTVLESATPLEARKLYEKHAGRVVLLLANVVLPGMNGPQFATELIAADPNLKVLFSSGTPMAHWSEPDFQAMSRLPVGSYSFLAKPFLPEELIRKVTELLRSTLNAFTLVDHAT